MAKEIALRTRKKYVKCNLDKSVEFDLKFQENSLFHGARGRVWNFDFRTTSNLMFSLKLLYNAQNKIAKVVFHFFQISRKFIGTN